MSKITEEFVESALRNGIIVRPSEKVNQDKLSGAAYDKALYASVIEMANLGFRVSIEEIKGMSVKSLTKLIENARKIVGADRNTKPVYPGFPKQVQELSTMTLLVEQLLHYWSRGALIPNYPDTVRDQISVEDIARLAPRETNVMKASEAAQIFIAKLTKDSTALSESDKVLLNASADLAVFTVDDAAQIIKDAQNGENLQSFVLVAKDKLKNSVSVNEMIEKWVSSVHNVDELLRVVLAVATEPVENVLTVDYDNAVRNLHDKYAKTLKMINVSRGARRAILVRLGALTREYKADALVTHRNLWRRVMRMVHPYSMKLDVSTKRALDIIHENVEYQTFNSLVEVALAEKNVRKVVELLSKNQPGNLLRRLVSILRMVKNASDTHAIVKGIQLSAEKARVATLISSYNGVLVTNDDHARVTRVAGLNNTLVEKSYDKVNEDYVNSVLTALRDALVEKFKSYEAPTGVVGVKDGDQAVSLVNRDAATTDRVMDRGEKFALSGKGDTVRLFNHWRNDQERSGYVDTGVVVLDEDFNRLAVVTWNSWGDNGNRKWSTYSGDKCVQPGDEAVEYIDVNVDKLKETYPSAAWLVMTLQSWSGFPFKNVDVIAGAMLRSDADAGEVFDARTLTTAFKPTTSALQSIPFAVDLSSGEMIWIDSSNGSNQSGVSAVSDETIGTILYDEILRPRMTLADLATIWAESHGVSVDQDQAIDKDSVMELLQ